MEKHPYCILCHASNLRKIYQKDKWRYLRCINCDLVSLYPRPSTEVLIDSYQAYLPLKPDEISKWASMMEPVIVKSADLIETRLSPLKGKLLDIGCGYGFFLNRMKSRGWQVEGIEISGPGRRYAMDKWNIHVYEQAIEHLCIPENSFDVVTLFYVIEHVHDPPELLKEVRRILKPGGLLLLRWPHSTPIIKILGPLSKKLDLYHTPYHLYDFSPRSINKLLNLTGFKEIMTMIGGYTHPSKRTDRLVSILSGRLAETLYRVSGGKVLLPGISKTTLACK